MARIRTIKPEFPQSESVGRLSRDARLCFILLWTLADDSGRLRGNSRMLASLLYPYDDDAGRLMDVWLAELDLEGCTRRYKIAGDTYVEICNWLKHQKIDKPSASKIPEFDESSRILANPRERSSGDQGSRIKEGIKDQGPGSISSAAPPDVQTVFDHWKLTWNHPGAELDGKRRARILQRLKNFTAAQVCDAISGFQNSDWHTGKDPKGGGKIYDKIETLLREDSQVEEGIRLLRHPPVPPPEKRMLSPVERVMLANGGTLEKRDERVVSEQRSNEDLGDIFGDVRQPSHSGFRRIGS